MGSGLINHDRLLSEQIEYYRARAGEYDDWFLRRGRYDRGPELNNLWHAEAEQARQALRAAVSASKSAGRVLELACGTGLWTEQLLPYADAITAVDAAPEVLEINRARIAGQPGAERVRYIQADIFAWLPPEQYDAVFFGFWLSHVPPERFDAFWQSVRAALAPGGRVFFVDSRFDPTSSAVDHRVTAPDATTSKRRLNDGRWFEIVKVFYDPADLEARLARLGFQFSVRQTAHYFTYGSGASSTPPTRLLPAPST
jgi:SAM-dependent methyltransferase